MVAHYEAGTDNIDAIKTRLINMAGSEVLAELVGLAWIVNHWEFASADGLSHVAKRCNELNITSAQLQALIA